MKFQTYITEKGKVVDAEDWGARGKKWEKTFMKACDLAGLKYQKNQVTGRLWDFHPVGKKWEKLLSDKDVNIKVYGTKWMFASSELYKELPWKELPEDFNEMKAVMKVKRILNKIGFNRVVFLKPKNKDVQSKIVQAVRNDDTFECERLLVKKNFLAKKIGNYSVRILTNQERVTSIVIDIGGKVFMRSEKPRPMGSGKTMMVTFRTPTPKISDKEQNVKVH